MLPLQGWLIYHESQHVGAVNSKLQSWGKMWKSKHMLFGSEESIPSSFGVKPSSSSSLSCLHMFPIPMWEWEEEQKLRKVIKELFQPVNISSLSYHCVFFCCIILQMLVFCDPILHVPSLSYLHLSIRSAQVFISGNCLDSGITCTMIPSSQMILANNFSACHASFQF